jgi:hypothetical protein
MMSMKRFPVTESEPARLLPLLYFLIGYVSLPLAFATVACAPRSISGFYYHARLIGVVHLVTLGWITAAILGLLYLALPLLIHVPLPAKRGDYWSFASFVIGLIGMVSHFWIQEFSGMAWSGLMVALPILHVGSRVVPALMAAAIPTGVKLPFMLAFGNIGLAAAAGVALGFDKVHHFLPGYVLSNVLAHAHLAAIGWAGLMVFGLTYLALPLMPVQRLNGRSIAVSTILVEIATLGLTGTLLAASRWAVLFAMLGTVAFARLLRDVWRMHRQRPAATVICPDVGGWHVLLSGVYLVVAAAIGTALAAMPSSEATLRFALVYGVCGLVGFLAQWLMGLEMRLVPLAFRVGTSRPSAIPAFVMWTCALPLLAFGFFIDSAVMLSAAGAAACVGTVAAAVQGAFVIAPAWVSWDRDRYTRRSAA